MFLISQLHYFSFEGYTCSMKVGTCNVALEKIKIKPTPTVKQINENRKQINDKDVEIVSKLKIQCVQSSASISYYSKS